MTVDCALHLDEATRTKEFDRLGPYHVGPSTLLRAFLELGRKRAIQHTEKYYRSDAPVLDRPIPDA
jgi:hypothetical protein